MQTELTTAPLYVQLKEKLKSQIDLKQLEQGSKIPAIRKLVQQFKVSEITVRRAINDLCNDGLLVTRHGHGTFVADARMHNVRNKTIAIFTKAHGHLYGNMAMSFVRYFQEKNYQSIVVDISRDGAASVIPKILHEKPVAVVLEGDFKINPDSLMLKEYHPVLTVTLYDEVSKIFAGNRVITDDFHGGYIAASHFIAKGHRQVLFIISSEKIMRYDSAFKRALSGFKHAFSENGTEWDESNLFIRDADSGKNVRNLTRRLGVQSRPTAVFSFGDAYVREVYNAAKEAKLNIPDDLAVVGYFNTPWCEMMEIPVTSVSIREDEIARMTVEKTIEKINNPEMKDETLKIKPELIIRSSSK